MTNDPRDSRWYVWRLRTLNARSIVLIVVAVLVLTLVIALALQNHRAGTFPPVGVACFDQFMSAVQSGYADPELDMPPFELKDVSSFQCSSKKGYEQYAIEGIDKAGHSFYVYHSGGGMAASGADSTLEHCYESDGEMIKNIKLIGRDPQQGQSACEFNKDLPIDPESTYAFSSDKGAGAVVH